MSYVKPCCEKIDGYYADELGHWRKTGRVGGQKVRSERHAQHQAMHRAIRTAYQNNDVMRDALVRYK
jgi:hypothetical protein